MTDQKVLLRRVLLVALSIIAVGFIGNAVRHTPITWETVRELVSWRTFAWAMLPCLAMLCAKAVLQTLLIEDFRGRDHAWWLTLSAYAEAQLIRYVPGKVWGVIYQGERLSAHTPRAVIWHTNLAQMVATNINGLAVMGGLMLIVVGYRVFGAITLAFGAAVTAWLLFSNVLTQWVRIGVRFGWPGELVRKVAHKPFRAAGQVALLEFEWVTYYLCWIVLLHAQHDWLNAIVIGTVYAGASLIGLLVVIMPSGWLVREAAFVWLGGYTALPSDQLLVLGLVARLFFMAGDALCAVLLMTMNFGHRMRTHAN